MVTAQAEAQAGRRTQTQTPSPRKAMSYPHQLHRGRGGSRTVTTNHRGKKTGDKASGIMGTPQGPPLPFGVIPEELDTGLWETLTPICFQHAGPQRPWHAQAAHSFPSWPTGSVCI